MELQSRIYIKFLTIADPRNVNKVLTFSMDCKGHKIYANEKVKIFMTIPDRV